jgi:hypothetical protein
MGTGSKLIPPHEAPPSSRSGAQRLSWRFGLVGASIGVFAGAIAMFTGASPWWWLAVPIGFIVAAGVISLEPFVLWGKR